MVIGIWLLAFVLLLLWSAFAWMAHALLGMLTGLPWEQVLSKLKSLSLPAPFAEWWAVMVDLFAPVLQVSVPILQSLLSFAGGALPVIVFVVWLLGALALLIIAIAGTVGAIWWRKNRAGLKGKLQHI
jgi:hypothetical protein